MSDAYGPTVPIGGGAWSGKDFNKVDRAGAMLARELALIAVKKARSDARVELRYEPGGAGPAQGGVWIDGRAAGAGGGPVVMNHGRRRRAVLCGFRR